MTESGRDALTQTLSLLRSDAGDMASNCVAAALRTASWIGTLRRLLHSGLFVLDSIFWISSPSSCLLTPGSCLLSSFFFLLKLRSRCEISDPGGSICIS